MSLSDCSLAPETRSAAIVASASKAFRERILKRLGARNWAVEEALGGAQALSLVEDGAFRAILLDRWLPDLDVQELVDIIKARFPHVQVMVLGSEDEEGRLTDSLCLPAGLPPDSPNAQDSMERGMEAEGSKGRPVAAAKITAGVIKDQPLPGMMGTSEAMQRAFRLARLVIPRNTTVLIMGETGTGKELMARAIHNLGPRAQHPFVIVNCAAIPEPLLESELFGHTRGAFTGAFQSRLGRIHSAHGGTLFLDEVGELPLSMQAKLLRFLQGGEVQRLGSPDIFQVDVRVIAATNVDLTRAMAAGRFNDALYYRLSVFPIELAPLRDRREDILRLARHFLDSLCREAGVPSKSLSFEVAKALEDYAWPGNVRELEHVIERAFILSENGSVLRSVHVDLPI
jgi:DNA-binding NtrC family response regulator